MSWTLWIQIIIWQFFTALMVLMVILSIKAAKEDKKEDK